MTFRSSLHRSLAVSFCVLAIVASAQSKVIYVDGNAAGVNDGTEWEDAYVFLQDALADANDSDKPVEIRVAQGTYLPDHGNGYTPGDKEATFVLTSGVTLKGGFAGVGASDPGAWDHQAHKTVLSGDYSGNDARWLPNLAENSHHVISCVEADATAVLDGFTVTGGHAVNSAGGGMYNDRASPTVRRCVFFDNYASTGGGMYNNFSTLTITDCTFDGNLAEVAGGIYNHESQPVIVSSIFHDNRATLLGGGGLYCVESDATVTRCLFIDNEASWGAGIHTWKGSPTVTHCTFANNHSSGWGAGMNNEIEGHAIVTHCIFWGNTPDQIRTMGGGMGRQFITDVTYSDIQGGYAGEGNIDVNPFLADPAAGDCHLKSQAGRWNPLSESWVIDHVTSPCIDAGDPNSPVASEPSPHGGVINLGAYGGTAEASKSVLGDPPARYSGGTGRPDDPYRIATAEDLMVLGEIPEDYGKHFILTADVDLDPALPGRVVLDKALIAPDTDPVQSRFQGTPFTGLFDGNGHAVSHLTVTGVSYLGLFGQLGREAMVFDLAVEAVDVNGTDDYVGGLVGENDGAIATCYSTGVVKGDRRVGGLVGRNDDGSVTSSYSDVAVSGNSDIGGLVGQNGWDNVVTMSYSTGIVSGTGYSVGGLIGSGGSTVTYCFWDTQASGQTTSAGGTGKTTADMQTAATFTEAGWGCSPVWNVDAGHDYPRFLWEDKPGQAIDALLADFLEGEGSEANPFLIYTVDDATIMANFPCEWDRHFDMAFLEGEGTTENPYLIYTADEMQILDIAPHQQETSFRLMFVEGEGTQESPYIIDNAGQIDLLMACPYEQDAYYTLGFVAGQGTQENPYLIYTTDELDLMGQSPQESDKHFMLMVDIDMSGITWSEPVIPNFAGIFDGNGHIISHLTIHGERSLGLFGSVTDGAQIKALGLVDVDIFASYGAAGALVADCRSSHIVDCYSTGTVTGSRNVGGLVAYHFGRRNEGITGCYSTCTVTSTSDYLCSAGGLVGENSGYMTGCYSAGTATGKEYIGGLVGRNFGGHIDASYTTGTVSGTGSYLGGLVGDNYGSFFAGAAIVTTSYSNSAVSGGSSTGGLVGRNWGGDVRMSYSSGEVSGTGRYIGGLLGENRDGTITDTYSTCTVTGDRDVGGLVGYDRYGRSTVTASFWDTQTSGQTASVGGIGLTTSEMQRASTFVDVGWDFVGETANGIDDVWWIDEGQDYPRLRSFSSAMWLRSIQQPHTVLPGETLSVSITAARSGERMDVQLYFGMCLPDNWTVSGGTFSWTGVYESAVVYDGDLALEQESTRPSPEGYYWWVGYGNQVDVEPGVASAEVQIQTTDQSGLFFLDYMLGDSSYGLNRDRSNDHVIECVDGYTPTQLEAVVEAGSVFLRWAAPSITEGLLGYNVYRDGELINTEPVSDQRYTDEDPVGGVSFYAVSALYEDGSEHFTVYQVRTLVFSEGTGQTSAPYVITVAEQLSAISDFPDLLDKHFILANDIDLAPDLPGARVFAQAVIPHFSGTFDGNGHEISHLTIEGQGSLGLFGQLSSGAEVKNLGVMDVAIAGSDLGVGALAGRNEGHVTNCYSTGIVAGTNNVGGLIGLHSSGDTVADCNSSAHVLGDDFVGGLVGKNEGHMTNCSSTGIVEGSVGVGGLTGSNRGSLLTCYGAGEVTGLEYVGGLTGINEGYVTQSNSDGVVSGNGTVGGLTGENSGTVQQSYSTSSVDGVGIVGGFVGFNADGSISSCYARGPVSGSSTMGGLVGSNAADVTECYSTGQVNGRISGGGLIGDNSGHVGSSFWDTESSGRQTSDGGTGRTTSEMQTAGTFLEWVACGNEGLWMIDEGHDYPRLAWENASGAMIVAAAYSGEGTGTVDDPYLIYTAEELSVIRQTPCDWDKHFRLMADIDLSGFTYSEAVIESFAGTFDGNGYTISHLTITGDRYLGLFGRLESGAKVVGLGIVDADIVGSGAYVGALVGLSHGDIAECYSTGVVSGGSRVGGLLGSNGGWDGGGGVITNCHSDATVNGDGDVGGLIGTCTGTVINCSSSATVSASDWGGGGLIGWKETGTIEACCATGQVSGRSAVGGLVGVNAGEINDCYSTASAAAMKGFAGGLTADNSGAIWNCYSTGSVSAPQEAGGLIGYLRDKGSVTNSFWNVRTSGQATSARGTGASTAGMRTASTFLQAGWDLIGETENGTEDIWWILEGQDYPRLWWELTEEDVTE